MKRARTPLGYLLGDRGVRRSVWALTKVILFILSVVAVYAVLFHLIMIYVEGRPSTIFTGVYWALTTMSTVGYGDVVLETDLGRLFSIVVLTSGIVLLLVVLPFTFIRFFYAPLLEAQMRSRTPRQVPAGTRGHVILCSYGDVASGVIERLEQDNIPYFVIESDLEAASDLFFNGISVVMGEVDSRETYEALAVGDARMVFANSTDPVNTNIAMTVREVSEVVPIVAIASQESAVEILRLSGATHVLPLKQWLGEQLANRVNAAHAQLHVIAHYEDLLIAELPVHHTPLVGKTIRGTRLREHTKASIIGVWERGRLLPALADHILTDASVPVVVGTEAQLDELNYIFAIYDVNPNPVLVIGGGNVGMAAALALKRKEVPVHLIERDPALLEPLRRVSEQVFIGDATNPDVLLKAGLKEAPSVLLTSKDDALNIYLAFQCRRLNPDFRLVSRITNDRNIETIHRAGADFVLGSASLGIEATYSILEGRELIALGEGVSLFSEPLPRGLAGKTLAESNIGARTGLSVIAVQRDGERVTSPPATTMLLPGSELLMFGGAKQHRQFIEIFGERR